MFGSKIIICLTLQILDGVGSMRHWTCTVIHLFNVLLLPTSISSSSDVYLMASTYFGFSNFYFQYFVEKQLE